MDLKSKKLKSNDNKKNSTKEYDKSEKCDKICDDFDRSIEKIHQNEVKKKQKKKTINS